MVVPDMYQLSFSEHHIKRRSCGLKHDSCSTRNILVTVCTIRLLSQSGNAIYFLCSVDGENQGVENLAKKQRDLPTCLQIHLLKLCQAAGLPEYVNTMAEDLLAYVMYKFKIDSEPAFVLQATILSLLWRAASLFKHWLDPEDLVTLAYNVLQYECDVNLVNPLYSFFKILRTEFQGLADFINPVELSNQFLKVPKLDVVAYPEAAHCDEVVRTTACQNLRWDTQLQLQGFYTNAPGTSADVQLSKRA